jgi:hypothetical protein
LTGRTASLRMTRRWPLLTGDARYRSRLRRASIDFRRGLTSRGVAHSLQRSSEMGSWGLNVGIGYQAGERSWDPSLQCWEILRTCGFEFHLTDAGSADTRCWYRKLHVPSAGPALRYVHPIPTCLLPIRLDIDFGRVGMVVGVTAIPRPFGDAACASGHMGGASFRVSTRA